MSVTPMSVSTSAIERVRRLVVPILADLGLELYDLEQAGGSVRVLVDRPGGADLEAIADATRMISRELDHIDPMPGRYTLEVSTPGLERPLRTPAHYRGALGVLVTVRTLPEVAGERRVRGVLTEVDDDGITVRLAEASDHAAAGDGAERRLAYHEIERAKTVFEWGPSPKPGSSPKPRKKAAS